MPALTEGGKRSVRSERKEDMLERIRYERRVEFCLEGINFFDEVRWGTYKETKFRGKTSMAANPGGANWQSITGITPITCGHGLLLSLKRKRTRT